jgi:RNA-directed DNA polymerase
LSHLKKLKEATDRKELAEILGYKPSALTSIVYKTLPEAKYTVFEIPKKSGGVRTIKAPEPKLKKLQSHLAQVLYACLAEIEAEKNQKRVSFGFRKEGRIADNAKKHKHRRYVLNLDLENFFPSFNFGRVRGFFLKDKSFELAEEVATTIAQIACDGVALPQGSPCSPIISELIGSILDLRLLRLAKKHGVQYSRYADDITFSTSNKTFPLALAVQHTSDPSKWALGDELTKKILVSGFIINQAKTRMQYRASRQMVTGLVVNDKVNVKSEYYRKARAMCHSLFQTGAYYKSVLPPAKESDPPVPENISRLSALEGILSHIYGITQSEERRSFTEQRQKPRAIRELYRRFLFYKCCVALEKPLIITEGKTDPVYLREAIKSRTAYQPQLGGKGQKGFEFRIRFFNYGGQAHEIMELGGGTGDLKSVILDYLRNSSPYGNRKPFRHKPMKHPVILVLDNDEGLAAVAGTIKTNFNKTINVGTTDPYYHITENLYLVKTPETNGQSSIEDLFPADLLKTKLKGKSFNMSGKNFDTEKHYSKEVFANSVVSPKASKIDFAGFDLLLDRIVAVLNAYKPNPS